jgi:sec-independent protein translocase protein TatB
MFGIGTGELLLLLLIALLVLGPERMPKLARDLGKTVNDLRKTSDELRSEFLNADRTLNAEKLLDVAARSASAPETAKAAEIGATTAEPVPPDVGATQAEVAPEPPPIPAEPEETAFDREARLARERIDQQRGT